VLDRETVERSKRKSKSRISAQTTSDECGTLARRRSSGTDRHVFSLPRVTKTAALESQAVRRLSERIFLQKDASDGFVKTSTLYLQPVIVVGEI
jgi:hypothetical protein